MPGKIALDNSHATFPALGRIYLSLNRKAMRVIIIGGVSGCGKSTVGSKLAECLSCPFVEGDDYHGEENLRKMRAGLPLTDTDRWPWLERLCDKIKGYNTSDIVVSCSMLKRSYRDAILSMLKDYNCVLVILVRPVSVVANALQEREGHFISSKNVNGWLQSQMRDLEIADDVVVVDAKDVDETVTKVRKIVEQLNK